MGNPNQRSSVLDLSFVDPRHGWVLAQRCTLGGVCKLLVRVTIDGGQTWHSLPTPGPSTRDVAAGAALSFAGFLRFATSRDGWARVSLTVGRQDTTWSSVSVTHDGGRTWRTDPRLARISTLLPLAGTVWAIETSGGLVTVLISPDHGHTWHPAPEQPHVATVEQVIRGDLRSAWIVGEKNLIATRDAGTTWQQVPDPCVVHHQLSYETMAALDARHLWMVCGVQPFNWSLGDKYLYASNDGGGHWQPLAASEHSGAGARFPGTIPASGGRAWGLIRTTRQRGWIVLDHLWFVGTHDGGDTWTDGPASRIVHITDIGVGPVVFVDPLHGWFAAQQWVLRTNDGGQHWSVTQALGFVKQ